MKITLTAARVNAGLSQKELAEKLGVKRNSIQRWESGYTEIKAKDLFNLCEVVGCSANDIILPQVIT